MTRRNAWAWGLVVALLVALLLSPLASRWPDGLDRVAETLHFREKERVQPYLHSPLAEYRMPQVTDTDWSTRLAGLVGTLAVFGIATLTGYVLRKRRRP